MLIQNKCSRLSPTPLGQSGFFCVRFVFSQGELTIKGGWAGVNEGSPGKLGTIAGEARYRHQPGDTVGSAHPKGGGRARPEPPICAQSAFSLAPRRAGPVSCPRTAAAF